MFIRLYDLDELSNKHYKTYIRSVAYSPRMVAHRRRFVNISLLREREGGRREEEREERRVPSVTIPRKRGGIGN